MKALFELFRRFDARRIFGFIRRLGGMSRPKVKCYDLRSTRALRVEGDIKGFRKKVIVYQISIHALRVEGDVRGQRIGRVGSTDFYPRPPGGGRQLDPGNVTLLEQFLSTPSGWRATAVTSFASCDVKFLSTPSGWRATALLLRRRRAKIYFYPRPPGGGRQRRVCRGRHMRAISIHALRVEGDTNTAV